MNKQRNVLVELSVITAFIIGMSALIWSLDPTPAPAVKAPTAEAQPDHPKDESPKDPQWIKGKDLFKSNCASCHHPKVAQTGPALIGVTKRWEDAGPYQGKPATHWLHVWIHNWNDAVASGYPYAVNIQHYNGTAMNTFTSLSDQDIDDILYFIEGQKVSVAQAP